MAVTAILAMGAGAAAHEAIELYGRIKPIDDVYANEEKQANQDDPAKGKGLNILIVGTDFRDAANAAIAGYSQDDAGMRSDSTMLLHIAADRSWAEVVPIPRDSMVAIPSCKLPDGSWSEPKAKAMFNSAFQTGSGDSTDEDKAFAHAVGCTKLTVETLTGLDIQHYLIIKMDGVEPVVNAIGGVTMCFPEPVKETKKYGTLDLPAGRVTLDGRTSIDFLRARHGKGLGLEMGSDLERIKRQKAFLYSAIQKIKSSEVLTSYTKVNGLASAVLSSVRPDSELASLTYAPRLAWSLRNLRPADIAFTDIPLAPDPANDQRVVWQQSADAIWERIKADKPPGWTPATAAAAGSGTGTAGTGSGGTGSAGVGSGGTGPSSAGSPGTAGTGAASPGTSPAPTASPVTPIEEELPGVCADGS